jgi:hypothetical protein
MALKLKNCTEQGLAWTQLRKRGTHCRNAVDLVEHNRPVTLGRQRNKKEQTTRGVRRRGLGEHCYHGRDPFPRGDPSAPCGPDVRDDRRGHDKIQGNADGEPCERGDDDQAAQDGGPASQLGSAVGAHQDGECCI